MSFAPASLTSPSRKNIIILYEFTENIMSLTVQTIQRLPYYLDYLKRIQGEGSKYVSATAIACELSLNDVQVRKDIAAIATTKGIPKVGFEVEQIIENIEELLGYNNTTDALIIGAGSLGRALLSNDEFKNYGLNIVAAFDNDERKIGTLICGKEVFDVNKLPELCKRMHIHIGIITVPAASAQQVCDVLVESGVKAIWNFAIKKLNVPEGVLVKNENLAASLAVLSRHLREENHS